MTQAAELVVVGSLNVDLVVRVPRLPRPGETVTGGAFSTDEGGKGANQAVAAARLGAHVAMIGRVGRDAYGERLRAALARDGIDAAGVVADPAAPTGVAAITVAADGENSIVVASGANHRVDAGQVEAHAAAIAAARLLVLQLEIPLPAVAAALRIAQAHGVATLLNAAPAAPLPPDLLAQVDWLVVNQGEAAQLLGQAADGAAAAQAAAAALRARGPRQVILTLGAQGLVHASGESVVTLPARRVAAVDTTGAGDTFVGAFAASLAAGLPPAAALRWGRAAAALAVTRFGTQAAMPRRAELLAQGRDPATDSDEAPPPP